MVLSMTGFASGKIGGYLVEVQTINKKGAEVSISLPRELGLKESGIRKKIGSLLQRGHAFVKVFSEKRGEGEISKDDCKKVHKHLTEIACSLDPSYKVSFDTVLNHLSKFSFIEDDTDWDKGLDELWVLLTAMREKEGDMLAKDIEMRADLILKEVEGIERENKGAPELFTKKIMERLEGLVRDEDKDRVLREVVLYAEKVDITEEVVRMHSHISQLKKLLSSRGEPIGRTIDFLVQEMMREANTMGSKVPGVDSVSGVIFIKGEIEKIRQQGSNVE